MIETYEFIAYLSYSGRKIGMRIRIIGDIDGNSVFDVNLKLLDKFGVDYNLFDTESPVIELVKGNNAFEDADLVPELTEKTNGFHRWLLYNSSKFGVSECFKCNCIDGCEMCPLSTVSGYCTGEFGGSLCNKVLHSVDLPVRNLVRYCKENYVKDVFKGIDFIDYTNDSSEVNNKADDSGVNNDSNVSTLDDSSVVNKSSNVNTSECKRSNKGISQFLRANNTSDQSKTIVKKNNSSSRGKVNNKLSYEELEAEVIELRSKVSLRRAFELKLNLFDDNFKESSKLKGMQKILSDKERKLIVLGGG